MPTSKDTALRKERRRWPLAVRLVLVLVAAVLANWGFCWVLEPYGTTTEVVWSEYRAAAGQDIDTLITGPSFAMDMDPNVIDPVLGSSSWSLSTHAQSLVGTRLTVETAIRDHGVRRVIIGLGYETIAREVWYNPSVTFVQAKAESEPISEQLSDWASLLMDPRYVGNGYSLTSLFPWSYDHVALSPSAIQQNIRCRLECATPLEASAIQFPNSIYFGKGHVSIDTTGNMEQMQTAAELGEDEKVENIANHMGTMREICELCAANDVQLVVVVVPRPEFEVLFNEDHAQVMGDLQELVEGSGGVYLDFTMVKPEVYQAAEDEFEDTEHLNFAGQERFSTLVAELLGRIDAGEDVSSLFWSYDEWDERVASVDEVSHVELSAQVTDAGVELEATVFAGSEVDVEYRFGEVDGTGAFVPFTDWSEEPTFLWQPEGHGSRTLRVEARDAANPDGTMRYGTTSVIW